MQTAHTNKMIFFKTLNLKQKKKTATILLLHNYFHHQEIPENMSH